MVGPPPVEAMKKHQPYVLPVVLASAAFVAYWFYRYNDQKKEEMLRSKYGNLRPVTPEKDLVKVPLNEGSGSGSMVVSREKVSREK